MKSLLTWSFYHNTSFRCHPSCVAPSRSSTFPTGRCRSIVRRFITGLHVPYRWVSFLRPIVPNLLETFVAWSSHAFHSHSYSLFLAVMLFTISTAGRCGAEGLTILSPLLGTLDICFLDDDCYCDTNGECVAKPPTLSPTESFAPSQSSQPSLSSMPSTSAVPSLSLTPSVSTSPSESAAPSDSLSPSSSPSESMVPSVSDAILYRMFQESLVVCNVLTLERIVRLILVPKFVFDIMWFSLRVVSASARWSTRVLAFSDNVEMHWIWPSAPRGFA